MIYLKQHIALVSHSNLHFLKGRSLFAMFIWKKIKKEVNLGVRPQMRRGRCDSKHRGYHQSGRGCGRGHCDGGGGKEKEESVMTKAGVQASQTASRSEWSSTTPPSVTQVRSVLAVPRGMGGEPRVSDNQHQRLRGLLALRRPGVGEKQEDKRK